MPVNFVLILALSLLLQGGSCDKQGKRGTSAPVNQDKRASNRNAAAESMSAADNRGKGESGMKHTEADGSAASPQRGVAAGNWGGEHVRLEVYEAGGAEVEYDCGHGAIEKMMLDGDGRFDVRGTHTRERGGPVRLGKEAHSLPARYTGKIDGQTMTLRVTLSETGEDVGAFTLTQGATPRLVKCR